MIEAEQQQQKRSRAVERKNHTVVVLHDLCTHCVFNVFSVYNVQLCIMQWRVFGVKLCCVLCAVCSMWCVLCSVFCVFCVVQCVLHVLCGAFCVVCFV